MSELDFLRLYSCFVAFLFGISIGSFLNVLIYRLPLGLNPSKGRSFCPNCHTNLKGRDLIPLFSYLFLRGRCRYCAQPISIRYFVVELLTGLVYTTTVFMLGLNPVSLSHLLVFSALIVIAYIDYDKRYIPNYLSLVVLLTNLMRLFLLEGARPVYVLICALVPPLLLLSASLISKLFSGSGFGFGDIKLALALGAGLQYPTLMYYLLLTFLTQVIILMCAKLAYMSDYKTFPYAPGLVATYVVYTLTQGLLGWI